MDFIKNLSGNNNNEENNNQAANAQPEKKEESGGGFMGKINNAFGGGQSGEAKEDKLDKAVDYVQEHVFGQGPQDNESAVEQAKDEQISDAIRRGYKGVTGKEFFVADKE